MAIVAVITLVGIPVLPVDAAGATAPAWAIQSTPNPAGAEADSPRRRVVHLIHCLYCRWVLRHRQQSPRDSGERRVQPVSYGR
jgi:hypothetical protein